MKSIVEGWIHLAKVKGEPTGPRGRNLLLANIPRTAILIDSTSNPVIMADHDEHFFAKSIVEDLNVSRDGLGRIKELRWVQYFGSKPLTCVRVHSLDLESRMILGTPSIDRLLYPLCSYHTVVQANSYQWLIKLLQPYHALLPQPQQVYAIYRRLSHLSAPSNSQTRCATIHLRSSTSLKIVQGQSCHPGRERHGISSFAHTSLSAQSLSEF